MISDLCGILCVCLELELDVSCVIIACTTPTPNYNILQWCVHGVLVAYQSVVYFGGYIHVCVVTVVKLIILFDLIFSEQFMLYKYDIAKQAINSRSGKQIPPKVCFVFPPQKNHLNI